MIGQRIGNYVIKDLLGSGGMGQVFRAVHEGIRSQVAIKVLWPEFSRSPEIAERFLNEARAVNAVRHPGLVSISDSGQLPDGTTYIVMELLEGESLRARLERTNGQVGIAGLRLLQQVATTLIAAHAAGIIHRDLKPENIMVVSDPAVPGGERAKVLDFGIAKLLGSEPEGARAQRTLPLQQVHTRTGATLGTPSYMAPEQYGTAHQVDARADVYALGVILFELWAGRPPFLSPNPGELMAMHLRDAPPGLRELRPDAPRALAELVQAMLAKRPSDRPGMAQVAAALEALERAPAAAPTPGARGRWLLLPGAALCVAAALWAARSPAPSAKKALVVGSGLPDLGEAAAVDLATVERAAPAACARRGHARGRRPARRRGPGPERRSTPPSGAAPGGAAPGCGSGDDPSSCLDPGARAAPGPRGAARRGLSIGGATARRRAAASARARSGPAGAAGSHLPHRGPLLA